MPSSISKARLSKAFNEGRRAASEESAQNPYGNAKLQELWERGRAQQKSGQLKTPIPPLEHGETRAERVTHNPPGSKSTGRPAPRPRNRPRPGGFRNPRQR